MARPLDPYRALELPRDATLDDVKAAYRRLAKLYHPDSAGERALPRFLAVQAAYEALTEGPGRLRSVIGGRARTTPPPGRPSSARPGRRADPWAGRSTGTGPRAARGTTGAAGTSGAPGVSGAPGAGPGTRAGPGARGPMGSSATPGSTGSGSSSGGGAAGGRAGSSRTRGPAGPRPRRTRRPPGSTSYDGAESEPFEPEWQGASWYGGSSGTYWTINPREFADPRKHGPEYLARGADGGHASRPRRARPGDPSAGRPGEAGDRGEAARAHTAGTDRPAGPFDAAEDRSPGDQAGGAAGSTAWSASADPRAWPDRRSRRSEVSAFGLIAAALLAIALLAGLFAVMAEPTAPGTVSVLPVVAFCGVAIVALVRILRRDSRPRA